jgi:hypothetical protein
MYDMKTLLGDFNAKVGMKDIFKLTMGNESLHEISNNSGVRIVNFARFENLVVIATFIFTPGSVLKERHATGLIAF